MLLLRWQRAFKAWQGRPLAAAAGRAYGVHAAPPLAKTERSDLLVVGTGVAGCAAALRAAQLGLEVTMLTSASDATMCNSYWAQGGIIYKAADDAPALLASDIYKAGAGLSEKPAVDKLTHEGPGVVEALLLDSAGIIPAANVPFDRNDLGELSLCLEASHNRARIIHWRDHTGKAITTSIVRAAAEHPRISLRTNAVAMDLAIARDPLSEERRCVGMHAYVGKEPTTLLAGHTVLATGGVGALFEHTSNPLEARGEGLGMAIRADVTVKHLEYVQFHPTTLYLPGKARFLLTEALRGEGAILRDRHGRAFAKSYHPDGELAPRDVVARMITSEMARQGEACMFLDISHRDADWLRARFPSIDAHCRQEGLDITSQCLPVVPASHYHCGGVTTDTEARTSLPGLLAAGEVSCTGLHGANRLASTSLLEGLVWGSSAADTATQHHAEGMAALDEQPGLSSSFAGFTDDAVSLYGDVDLDAIMLDIRRTMWEDVGVVRRPEKLQRARAKLQEQRWLMEELVTRAPRMNPPITQLRNAVTAAVAIAEAASRNMESCGAHCVMLEEEEGSLEISASAKKAV